MKLMIVGAGGGIGHVALQLAKRKVLVYWQSHRVKMELLLWNVLGADSSVNGYDTGVMEAAKDFAPKGLDAVLAFTNSEGLAEAMKQVKKGGRIAYPNGLEPEPKGLPGVEVQAYDNLPSPEVLESLNSLIGQDRSMSKSVGSIHLKKQPQVHRDILKHQIGKLALSIQG